MYIHSIYSLYILLYSFSMYEHKSRRFSCLRVLILSQCRTFVFEIYTTVTAKFKKYTAIVCFIYFLC